MSEFEPRILALCCHYCAYAAADLAGTFRAQYPANVRIVRFPCSGKVDPIHIMQAFEGGVDGVLVAGCLEGGCHFQEGNLRAKRRVAHLGEILREIGVESDRLRMVNLSSAMGQAFAKIITEFTNHIKQLGPSPLSNQSHAESTQQ
jgi:F420-non-reducing hydrogenase iron-sulfur subunit